mgnify:CR=1 FL=1
MRSTKQIKLFFCVVSARVGVGEWRNSMYFKMGNYLVNFICIEDDYTDDDYDDLYFPPEDDADFELVVAKKYRSLKT